MPLALNMLTLREAQAGQNGHAAQAMTPHAAQVPPGQMSIPGRPAPVDRENEKPQSSQFRTMRETQLEKAGFTRSQAGDIARTAPYLPNGNAQLRNLGFKGPLDYGHLLIKPIYVKVFGKETEILYISNGQTSVYRVDEENLTGSILSLSRSAVMDTVWYGNNWKAVEEHFGRIGAVAQIAQAAVTAVAVSVPVGGVMPESGVPVEPAAGASGKEAEEEGTAPGLRTALARHIGEKGEMAAGAAEGRVGIKMPSGITRFPDIFNAKARIIGEVKNVQSLSFTQQLRDYAAYAKATGWKLELWVRPSTRLSGPLLQAKNAGQIIINYIPGAK